MPGRALLGPRQRHRRQRVVAVLIALLVVPAAAGAWSATGGGASAAGATSMPTGATPVAVAVLSTVTVSWSAASVGGVPVAGYVIKRYDAASGAPGAIGGTCAGVVAVPTCADAAVPAGTWRYSVTPVHHAWTGAEGARSAPVVVAL